MYDWMRTAHSVPTAGGRTERMFVYTHGGAIKYLASYLEDWTHARSYATEIGNATLNLFVAEDDEFRIGYLNRTADEL